MTDFADLVVRARDQGIDQTDKKLNSLERTTGRAEKATDSFGRKSAGLSGILGALGRQFVVVGASMAATFGARAVISQISTFETAMSGVAAVTRATDSDMRALRQTATDFGASTEFSAAQAADGLRFLGMAGFTATEAIASLGATLDLATASGMDLASSADITSNIMSGFGIAADNAGQVADILAAASSRSNTNVAQLGEAMKFAAPVAAAMGISINDTAAAVGTLSDAGLQGAQAGTGLRAVLASLAQPTDAAKDALAAMGLTAEQVNPEVHGMAAVMGLLGERGMSSQAAMAIFGREAASSGLVLASAGDRLGEFGDELSTVEGEAGRMAETMRDNLGGDMATLQSTISGLILAMGEAGLTAAIRGVVQAFTAGLSAVSSFVTMIGDARGYFIAAALGATAFYTPAIISASVATAGLVAGLVTLRGALIASGIGAFVVLAGYMINQFLRLVEQTGGFGEALDALREIGLDVWTKVQAGASLMAANLQIFFNDIAYAWVQIIGNMSVSWGRFIDRIAATTVGEAMGLVGGNEENAMNNMASSMSGLTDGLADLMRKANQAQAALDAPMESIERLRGRAADANDELGTDGGLAKTVDDVTDAVTEYGGAADGASTATGRLSKEIEGAEREAEELRKEFQRPMVTAINGVADAFGDFVVRGFRNFGSFKDAVIGEFRDMLAQMVAMAARTQLMKFVGGMGNAMGGGGGIMASLGSGFMSGASSFVSGVTSGGIAGGLSAIGTAASGATASLSGAAAALGAIAVPVAGVALAVSFFSTKTKELDNGLRITANGADTLVQSFRKIKKTRFWGLSSKRKTSVWSASAETSEPIIQAVSALQDSIMDAAGVLGLGADLFDGFSKSINVSLKGLNDEERQEAIQKAITDIGDSFASMIPGLDELRMSGESATQSLERLVNNVTGLNAWWDRLGFSLYDLSLAGADAASSVVELFGGLDDLSEAATRYYTQFYSDQERTAQAIREMGQTLQTLGIDVLPSTRAQFRALVDAAEAAGDNALVANLIEISGAFAEITQSSDDLARSLEKSQFATRVAFDFARAQVQQGAGAIDFEETDTQLLREIVTAIREGNIAIARNTADTYREVLRQSLTPVEEVA